MNLARFKTLILPSARDPGVKLETVDLDLMEVVGPYRLHRDSPFKDATEIRVGPHGYSFVVVECEFTREDAEETPT